MFFTQKTAYERRISDWSSDVCSSDLASAVAVNLRRARIAPERHSRRTRATRPIRSRGPVTGLAVDQSLTCRRKKRGISILSELPDLAGGAGPGAAGAAPASFALGAPRLIFIIRSNSVSGRRSEEHKSELQA